MKNFAGHNCRGLSACFFRLRNLLVATGLLLVPSSIAFSGSGTAGETDPYVSEGHYIWISTGKEQEPYKKISLSPTPTDQVRLFPLDAPSPRLEPEGQVSEGHPQASLNVEGRKGESNQLAEQFPSDKATDPSRMKTKTHGLAGSDVNPSPAILLIEEEGREDKLYFGFLSFTIRW